MAVLDYVLANSDRHDDNYRTQPDGRPAGIDNGYCLPRDGEDGIRSDFVADALGQPLQPALARYPTSNSPHASRL